MKNEEEHTATLRLKYIGKEPKPTGKLEYAYQTEGGGNGSGIYPIHESEWQIFELGSSGGNGAIAAENSTVKMQVSWNGKSEEFELKPSKK